MKKLFFVFLGAIAFSYANVEGMDQTLDAKYKSAPASLAADQFLSWYEIKHISLAAQHCIIELDTGYSLFINKNCLKSLADKGKFIQCVDKLNWWNNSIIVSTVGSLENSSEKLRLVLCSRLHAIAKPEMLFNNLIQYIQTRIQERSWAFDYQNGPIAKMLRQGGLEDAERFLKSVSPAA